MILKNLNNTRRMNTKVLAIKSSSLPFTSKFNGYIGLAPFYELKNPEYNFLYRANQTLLIDHPVFSIYTDIYKPNNSFIKFGSYDQSGILANQTL